MKTHTIQGFLKTMEIMFKIVDGYDLYKAIFCGELPNGEQMDERAREQAARILCNDVYTARETVERLKAAIDEI